MSETYYWENISLRDLARNGDLEGIISNAARSGNLELVKWLNKRCSKLY